MIFKKNTTEKLRKKYLLANKNRAEKYAAMISMPEISDILDKYTDKFVNLYNLNSDKSWSIIRNFLIYGRAFFEIHKIDNKLMWISIKKQHDMLIICKDSKITGYRLYMFGKNSYIDFLPDEIISLNLGHYGPDGINDYRSLLEDSIITFNQLNALRDASFHNIRTGEGEDWKLRLNDLGYFRNKLITNLETRFESVLKNIKLPRKILTKIEKYS